MDFVKKYIVQVGLIGISVLVYMSSEELSDSARAFPRTMAVSLLVLVVLLMISNYMKQKKITGTDSAKSDNPGSSLNVKTMTILVGFIVFNVLFVWLLPIIGFEIAGFSVYPGWYDHAWWFRSEAFLVGRSGSSRCFRSRFPDLAGSETSFISILVIARSYSWKLLLDFLTC